MDDILAETWSPEAEVVVDDEHVTATMDLAGGGANMRLDAGSDDLVVRVGASAWRVPLPVTVEQRLIEASLLNGVLDVRLKRA